jgi:nucleotide-binding universal stress UspA family protein
VAAAAFSSALVVIDASRRAQYALSRAVRMSATAGFPIDMVELVEPPPEHLQPLMPADIQAAIIAEANAAMSRRVRLLERRGLAASGSVLTGRPEIEVVRHVVGGGHDVVFTSGTGRGHASEHHLDRLNQKLLRTCPAAVWVVGRGGVAASRTILALIDPGIEAPEHRELSGRILARALSILDEAPDSRLLILHAWSALGERKVLAHAGLEAQVAYLRSAEQRARERVDELLRTLTLPEGRTEIRFAKGDVAAIATRVVRAERVDLVVMGTVARRGLGGLVIGNTAERVLAQLRCSVLAIKPDGWVSPIA